MGVPILIVFLFLGLLLDTRSFIEVNVSNYTAVQLITIFASIIIIFSGGLGTAFKQIKLIWKERLSLASLGVIITFLVVGLSVHLFHMDSMLSLLLGAFTSRVNRFYSTIFYNSSYFNICCKTNSRCCIFTSLN